MNERPGFRLYSESGVGWVTFWGTALAGGVALGHDLLRIGRPVLAIGVLLGVESVLVAEILVISMFDPHSVLPIVLSLALWIGNWFFLKYLARSLLFPRATWHVKAGGKLMNPMHIAATVTICYVGADLVAAALGYL